jgi:hypothetical protein
MSQTTSSVAGLRGSVYLYVKFLFTILFLSTYYCSSMNALSQHFFLNVALAAHRLQRSLLLALLAMLFIVAPAKLSAQVNAYTARAGATATNFAYSTITDGRVVASGDTLDDQVLSRIPLGFEVNFNGRLQSTISVSVNGFAGFDVSSELNPLPFTTDGFKDIVAAFGTDVSGMAVSRLITRTSGTAPNRSFVVQWQNFTGSAFSNRGDRRKDTLNFQIRIDENGTVSASYGRLSFASVLYSSFVQVGLKGRAATDLATRIVEQSSEMLRSPWLSSKAGRGEQDVCTLGSERDAVTNEQKVSAFPAEGFAFAWLPASAVTGMLQGGMTMGMTMGMTGAQSLSPVQLASPATGVTFALPGTLRWQPLEGATAYRLQIADNAELNEPLVDIPVSVTQFFVRPSLLSPRDGSQYFWAVQAQRGDQILPRSDVRSWRTQLLPRTRQATQRMFFQGQRVSFIIYPEFYTFPSEGINQTVPMEMVADSGDIAGTNTPRRFTVTEARITSATSLTITMTVPEGAQTGTWGLATSGDTAGRERNLFTIRPQDQPPVTSGFSPRVHGFKFDNSEESVWNRSIWGGIDYSSAAFPAEVQALNARSSDFPSWVDYVGAWERRNSRSAFTDAERKQPRREVVVAWRREKTKWGGSCHGFATSALAAWAGLYTFDKPAFELDVNPTLRTLINRNQIFQDNPKTGLEDDGTPNSTVRQIIESWKLPRGQHFEVGTYNVINGESKGAHALVPYRITSTVRPDGDIIDSVFCYDMNFPGVMDSAIAVNRTRNTWAWWGLLNSNERTGDRPWSGNAETASLVADGTALTNWVVTQNSVQAAPALASKGNVLSSVANAGTGSTAEDDSFIINFGDDDTTRTASTPFARLTNRLGQRIESRGSLSLRPQIPDASVVRPISTSANVVATGFNVPRYTAENFRLNYTPNAAQRTNSIGWDIGRFGLYGEFTTNLPASTPAASLTPVTFAYDRSSDYVKTIASQPLSDAGFALYKTDPTDSLYTNYVQLSDFSFNANDSLDMQLVGDGSSFVLTNYASTAKRFDIYLERYDSTAFESVAIPARARQTYVVYDWNRLKSCDVQVLMDRRLAGKPDTAYFLRQAGRIQTSVREGSRVAGSTAPTEHHLSIAPNPASDLASVRYVLYDAASVQTVRIELVNMVGVQVAPAVELRQFAGQHTYELDTRSLPVGAYLCRLTITGSSNGAARTVETRLVNIVR